MKPLKIIVSLALLPLLTIQSTHSQNWKGKIETKDGIVYVYNPEKGLLENDRIQPLKAEKLFSVGSMEAEENYLFTHVHAISTDPAGNVYTCDSKEDRIQVYNQKGKYLFTIGRKGQGPGELQRPFAVRVGKDQKIYVQDALNTRISVFNSKGKYDSIFRYEGYMGDVMEIDSDGNILLYPWPRYDDEKLPIVVALDTKGNKVAEYGERLKLLEVGPFRGPWYAYNGFTIRPDGTLLVYFHYPYRLQIFQSGRLQKVIEKENSLFSDPVIVKKEVVFSGHQDVVKSVAQRCQLDRVLSLPDGRFVVVWKDNGKNYQEAKDTAEFLTFLDLFNADGQFLKSYSWDHQENGRLLHVDAEGFWYSNSGDSGIVPGVSKWRVVLD